ncbi:MAG: YdeI/OmpD-associated family protein [Roseivivax sp.]|nr:YdeI/OmpD-associated family protein [Roseivivax sp.]
MSASTPGVTARAGGGGGVDGTLDRPRPATPDCVASSKGQTVTDQPATSPAPDPRIEAFYARPGRWQAELSALRAILLEAGLGEEFKWRGPCYTAHGGNIGLAAGFKDRCVLSFFKGALLSDPAGILRLPGDNSRAGRVIEVADVAQIAALRPTILAYLHEAIENERLGRKLTLPKDDLDMPPELAERLAGDASLRDAFEALTPGRRRSWIMHVSMAKQPATRHARIDKAAPSIHAGKGLNDR